MELILPIIVVVTVLVLGGRDGMNTHQSQPALEPASVQEFRHGDHQFGCELSCRRHRDLTIPYAPHDPSGLEHCDGNR